MSRRGTVYAEYFIAAAAMAAATFAVWNGLQGPIQRQHEGLRDGIMGALEGPCTVDASRRIVGC
jgi:hypothetical protein